MEKKGGRAAAAANLTGMSLTHSDKQTQTNTAKKKHSICTCRRNSLDVFDSMEIKMLNIQCMSIYAKGFSKNTYAYIHRNEDIQV